MLWRLRTTLPDQPGALAALAQECGKAGVNVVGLQVFPGVDRVTDELVLRVPAGWDEDALRVLVERAGGESVVAARCTEAALGDQPTRYVEAARAILAEPASFPEVAARLFDADTDVEVGAAAHDVMEMTVGDVHVQIRRAAPFTAVEHTRGAALAELVSDVLSRERPVRVPAPQTPPDGGGTPTYVVGDSTVTGVVEGTTIGVARILPATIEEPDARPVELHVDPGWQRRGTGTRLLGDVARLARTLGADEVLFRTRSDNQAVLPMVLAAGLRGRIRMSGDQLTVRIVVRSLRPLTRAVGSGDAAGS